MSKTAPPHSIEAEQSVLGGILLDTAAINKVVDILEAEDFYHGVHSKIYRGMVALHGKGLPIDAVTLMDVITKDDLAPMGGVSYLVDLVESTPTAANVAHHARVVKGKAIKRWIISGAMELADEAYSDEADINTLIDVAQKKFTTKTWGAHQSRHFRVVLNETLDDFDALEKRGGGTTGIPTGLIDVDTLVGGLQNSDLIVIAARPSMGKTSLLTQVATNTALAGKRVALFTIEMGRKQIAKNILASQALVPTVCFREALRDDSWKKIGGVIGGLADAPFFIDDSSRSPMEIARQARKIRAEQGLDILFIDHLQEIRESDRIIDRVAEVNRILSNLKALAKELDIPVVLSAQLSRKVEDRGGDCRPRLSDLKDSGAVEEKADLIMFIWREDYYLKEKSKNPGTAEIIVAKHRNGPTGVATVKWSEEYVRFDNLEIWRGGYA